MRNNVVKKIALQADNYSNKFDSYACVRIDHSTHTIEWISCGGKTPLYDAFISFLVNDKDAREELIWSATEYERKHHVWVQDYISNSYPAARTLTLKYTKATVPAWAVGVRGVSKDALRIHISCYCKLNKVPKYMFSGDLFEILMYMEGYDLIEAMQVGTRKMYCYPKNKTAPGEIESIFSECGGYSREYFSRKNEGN